MLIRLFVYTSDVRFLRNLLFQILLLAIDIQESSQIKYGSHNNIIRTSLYNLFVTYKFIFDMW